MEKKSRDKTAERRNRILRSATHVFAQHGYGGATVLKIARHCEVHPTNIIGHFGKKYHLYEAVLTLAYKAYKSDDIYSLTDVNRDYARILVSNYLHSGDPILSHTQAMEVMELI